MTLCVVDGGHCQCQPDDGVFCPAVTKLKADLAAERARADRLTNRIAEHHTFDACEDCNPSALSRPSNPAEVEDSGEKGAGQFEVSLKLSELPKWQPQINPSNPDGYPDDPPAPAAELPTEPALAGMPAEPKRYDNDGYLCETGVAPRFVLSTDYDALRKCAEGLAEQLRNVGKSLYDSDTRAFAAEARAKELERLFCEAITKTQSSVTGRLVCDVETLLRYFNSRKPRAALAQGGANA